MKSKVVAITLWPTLACSVFMLGACTHVQITPTDKPNEFVVVERHNGLFSTVAEAKAGAVEKAKAHCSTMGKKYVEKYAIDRPHNWGQFPESTLYFTCVE